MADTVKLLPTGLGEVVPLLLKDNGGTFAVAVEPQGDEPEAPTIGGVAIGSEGTGLLAGYVLSAGDEFTELDLISAANPGGRYGTGRAYSNGGMRGPASGPLAVMHDVSPDYTGWADSNRGVPIASLADSHTIVPGEGTGAIRLLARRQTAPEQTKLATGVAGQIENGAMIHGAADVWVNAPAAVAIRARIPAGLYGQHPTLWMLSAYPPGGPTFTGNEYGWEGGRTENEPYHNGHVAGVVTQNHGAKTPAYRDDNFHTYLVKATTDYKFYADGVLKHTAAVDPNQNGNKPDYLIVSNHVYNAAFEGQTYDAANWAANPAGAAIDIEWVQYWRPVGGVHYEAQVAIPDTFVAAGAALNIALPPQATLWGATGLSELVTAVALEREQPGISSNTATFGLMPAGIGYDAPTRVLSGNAPAQAGLLIFAVGVTGDGNTCKTARIRIFVAPKYSGPDTFTFSVGVAVDIDVYAMFDCGRLFQAGPNPKGLAVSGLPAGLAFSAADGRITGTPSGTGTGSIDISSTNSAGQTTAASHAYATTDPAAGIPAPTLTGNPALLASWDFGNASTLTTSGGSIDSISGADGTAHTLSQTGTARPTAVTRDGKVAARFTSSQSQFLQMASGIGQAAAKGLTVWAIVEPATVATSQAILDISNGASTGGLNRLMLSGGTSGYSGRKGSSTGFTDANLASSFTTTKRQVLVVFSPNAGGVHLYVDGVSVPVDSTIGAAWPTGITHTTMGSRRVSNAQDLFDNGWKWRYLAWDVALNATQIEEVHVYGAAHYGVANNA